MGTISKMDERAVAAEPSEHAKEATAAAFGLSAAFTAVFNVVLAFVKDSYPPLNAFMAQLTGHHWRTHGLADVVLFVLVGWLFTARGIPSRGLTDNVTLTLVTAVVAASAALGLWFLFA